MAYQFDVVVVGGGHAGVEAAWMASKLGAHTALVTLRQDTIGFMSCNPAIGGLGKGQIVREIDALGGLMGLAIDRAGIQFRMLNRSKGPAVRAPRAQADRDAYILALQALLSESRSLEIIEGSVERFGTRPEADDGGRPHVCSVTLRDGRVLETATVVVAAGTFMRGLIHCGPEQTTGGRIGEPASAGISDALQALRFTLLRLKTGTPPRVHRDSIDYHLCEPQPGDEIPEPFSWMTDAITQPQVNCWITWTNPGVHQLVLANLDRAPMYTGQIQSTGPRYCPSIEDKAVRFADKSRHQIFLEPEGYNHPQVYCNGISTSLPKDVQESLVHRIPGLERAKILQYGYAIEYDFVPTDQTKTSLESKPVGGLFLAGQINGTSGYEEAGGQGLVAGVNAVRLLRKEEPFVLGRDESYIGVMIDDLITRPPVEPYRMFTSRAEYRLFLRADNADQRLTPVGHALGTVDGRRWKRFCQKQAALVALEALCDRSQYNGVNLSTWIRRPEADLDTLAEALPLVSDQIFSCDILRQVLIEAKYEGYYKRQERQIERFRRLESLPIPDCLDYQAMPELRIEARERLAHVTPRTLGQASRIPGVSPADVTIIHVYLSGRRAFPASR